MKHILFILLVITSSCKEKKSTAEHKGYAFDNYKYHVEINNVNSDTIQEGNTVTSSSITRKSKDQTLQRDTLEKIFAYNFAARKRLNEFYKTASYKPSINYNHIEHIRKYSPIGQLDGKRNEPNFFIDYVIQNNLENPMHEKYITDRKTAKKTKKCSLRK